MAVIGIENAITRIINDIPSKQCFDSHFIIQSLIENYSDDYITFCSSYIDSIDPTKIAHLQIGNKIKKLCKDYFFNKLEYESWSYNIHHKLDSCALYQKV